MFAAFPKTRLEFEAAFTREEDCLAYLAKLRWPQGFVCPKCGHTGEPWTTTRDRYVCAACRHQASVTAGTIFHKTRKPLALWFRGIWCMTVHKHGSNALGLMRELSLGSYHTAWEWYHKLRHAMVTPDRAPLDGAVEVDETFVGGPEPGKPGRGAGGKAMVAVAVEDLSNGLRKGIGRIRLQRIPDGSAATLNGFVEKHVIVGSRVRTDGWSGYNQLRDRGYLHEVVIGKRPCEPGEHPLKICHLVISLFKRLLLGAYQGAIHFDQLDRYLEEFAFRFNRRRASSRMLLIFRVLQNAVATAPFPVQEIELGLRAYMRGCKQRRLPYLEAFSPEDFPGFAELAEIPF